MEGETLEQVQTRHRKEQRELQGRITNKKKGATKKTRKGVNDDCAELERQLREQHEAELQALNGGGRLDGSLQDRNGEENEEEQKPEAAVAEGKTGEEDREQGTRLVHESRVNGITHQLQDAKLADEAEDAQEATGPATQQQEQAKKRNRQKERLARRAAEQEAAAEAAEVEAANMVDHGRREREAMEPVFRAHGLVEKDIQPDGHCLFAAVADQLAQHSIPLHIGGAASTGTTATAPFRTVRAAAASYMEEHADLFAPFLEEPLAGYADKIRRTAEWGGQLELTALASRYGVDIRVVQDGRIEPIQPAGGGGGDARKTIWLAYYRRGYALGEHYNSLRKKDEA